MGAHHCTITRQILADSIIAEQALFTPPLKAEFFTDRKRKVCRRQILRHPRAVSQMWVAKRSFCAEVCKSSDLLVDPYNVPLA